MTSFWPRLFKRVKDSPVPKIFSSYWSSNVAAVLRPRSRARRMKENGAYGWNEARLAVRAGVADDAVAPFHLPGPARGHGAGQHEGVGVAARGGRQVAREEAQPHRSRADEHDLEGERGVAVVLGPGKLVRAGAHQRHVHLVERVAGLPHVAI